MVEKLNQPANPGPRADDESDPTSTTLRERLKTIAAIENVGSGDNTPSALSEAAQSGLGKFQLPSGQRLVRLSDVPLVDADILQAQHIAVEARAELANAIAKDTCKLDDVFVAACAHRQPNAKLDSTLKAKDFVKLNVIGEVVAVKSLDDVSNKKSSDADACRSKAQTLSFCMATRSAGK